MLALYLIGLFGIMLQHAILDELSALIWPRNNELVNQKNLVSFCPASEAV